MKQLIRLLIVAIFAGAVATIIVQRDRLRQMDREQLASQIRELVQSVIERGKEAASVTADTAEPALDAAGASLENAAEAATDMAEEAAEAATDMAEDAAEAVEESSEASG